MRILIFSLSYYPHVGGAEVAVKEITDRFLLSEAEFDMVTLRFSPHDKPFEKIGHVNVYRIGSGEDYFNKILFVPRAALFALRRRYDLYWAMMTYMLFPIVLLRLLGKKTKYALTLQDGDPFEHVFSRWFILPFRPLLSYGFRHAYKVQAISTFLARWAKKMGYKGHVEVIPNGIDLTHFTRERTRVFDPSDVVLITTSRLVEKNGMGDIIAALPHLPQDVRLKIVGTGPLEHELKKQARDLGVSSRIEFAGFVPPHEIPSYLYASDIFVRPSLSEGMGNSFIEAAAAGLPIVGTKVGGIPDFLKDGETGLFCEPHNPESIARAVKRLIEDEALRQKITNHGRKLAHEGYGWDLIAKHMKSRVLTI